MVNAITETTLVKTLVRQQFATASAIQVVLTGIAAQIAALPQLVLLEIAMVNAVALQVAEVILQEDLSSPQMAPARPSAAGPNKTRERRSGAPSIFSDENYRIVLAASVPPHAYSDL